MSMQPHPILKATALGVLLALVVIRSALAVDGVIEINQVRAKAGGVTPGDTPLFPVTIDQPGSYRLTGNLDVTDASARPGSTLAENTTAIHVTANDVTIDLNGFMIKSPTSCSGTPLMCSPMGSGMGIDANAPTQSGVAVLNGTVRGMGANGMSLGDQSLVEKVRAVSNGSAGIAATTVTNCTADKNAGAGIGADTVANCTADNNGIIGILAVTVANCTARFSGGTGIGASTATGCSALANGGKGIVAITAIGCTADSNVGTQISANGIAGHNVCGPPFVPCP